jgi:hypothetical protein
MKYPQRKTYVSALKLRLVHAAAAKFWIVWPHSVFHELNLCI